MAYSSNEYRVPSKIKAWVLGRPDEGRICLAGFPHEKVLVDLAHIVRNNIYVFGIRGEGKSATHRTATLIAQKRFDAQLIHTHTFSLAEVPTAIRYARERIEDAIKVVVKMRSQ
jgi:L-iditol 2-dehydrogenase